MFKQLAKDLIEHIIYGEVLMCFQTTVCVIMHMYVEVSSFSMSLFLPFLGFLQILPPVGAVVAATVTLMALLVLRKGLGMAVLSNSMKF
jgi:hypothetical protein